MLLYIEVKMLPLCLFNWFKLEVKSKLVMKRKKFIKLVEFHYQKHVKIQLLQEEKYIITHLLFVVLLHTIKHQLELFKQSSRQLWLMNKIVKINYAYIVVQQWFDFPHQKHNRYNSCCGKCTGGSHEGRSEETRADNCCWWEGKLNISFCCRIICFIQRQFKKYPTLR